jgi:hypothetical protein
MPREATTLTLSGHKVELRPVAAHAGLRAMIEAACQGLSITPERLRRELEENGDIANLVSGALQPAVLRLVAETLNTMQYAGSTLESTPEHTRRRVVLSMLAANPRITYAITSNTEIEPDSAVSNNRPPPRVPDRG